MNDTVIAHAPPASQPTLRRTTATGFLWLMAQGVTGRVASFCSQLILARLLLPEAFGQIGLAYTVTALVTSVIGFGIDDVLLSRRRTLLLWVAPAFWSSFALALAGMGVMLVAAPVAAHFYHAPGLTGLIAVLAAAVPLSALSMVPVVRLRSELNFKYLGAYATVEMLAMQLGTIVCAAAGCGAYSFVLPMPAAGLVKAIVFWRRAPVALRPGHRRAQYRHIMGSGLLLFGAKLINAVINQGATMVLGLMASASVVGMYFFAFRLAAQPMYMLAGSFGNVLFPAFAQMQGQPARQMDAALRASRILAYTVTPVCFLQAAVTEPLLHLMFGARWDGAIPLMQILSVGLPGDAIAWVAGALLIARGEFTRDFNLTAVFAPVFFACAILGAWCGAATGVAIGVSLFYALIKPFNSWLVYRNDMGIRHVLVLYVVPTLLAACGMGSAVLLGGLVRHLTLRIGIIGITGPVFYLAAMRLATPGVLREIIAQVPSVKRRPGSN